MTAADLTPLPCMHDTYACSHHGGVGPPYLPFGCSSGSWSLGGRLSLWDDITGNNQPTGGGGGGGT